MAKKITVSLPDELYHRAHKIVKDKSEGTTTWGQLIGLGVQAFNENPQLIERINKVETAISLIIPKLDELKQIKAELYNLNVRIETLNAKVLK